MRYFLAILCLLFLGVQTASAGLEIGQIPPEVVLSGDLGGRLDGSPWDSKELKGKVHVVFYVDPDEKNLNNDASEALLKEQFPRDRYQSFAIINMDATWLPNFAITSSLEEKQKRYPTAIYVRDYDKVLVKSWGVSDDTSDVLAFDKDGKLLFRKDGKLTSVEIKKLIEVIRNNLDK